MIEKNIIHNINIEVHAAHAPKEILESFIDDFESIQQKYVGYRRNEESIKRLAAEIEMLLHNPRYNGIMVRNDQFYCEERWGLDKILSEYEEHYPKRYNPDKKRYSNMEVNNMLFDLSIKGIIEEYDSPAINANLPHHNNKLFDGSVRVNVPLINFTGKGVC